MGNVEGRTNANDGNYDGERDKNRYLTVAATPIILTSNIFQILFLKL